MEGIGKHGLMAINEGRSDQDFALGTAVTSQETAELWHKRFGTLPIGYDNLYKLQSKSTVDGISVAAAQFKDEMKKVCEPCNQAAPAPISRQQLMTWSCISWTR